MKKRLSKKGFSLVETLVALLVVSLLTGAIAVGITTAVGVHGDALFASQSDILASTLNTAIGDVLRYATDISGEENPTFQNAAYGLTGVEEAGAGDGGRGRLQTGEDGRLYLTNALLAGGGYGSVPLVGGGAYTDLTIENFTLGYDGSCFDGEYTITDSRHSKKITFAFHPVNS